MLLLAIVALEIPLAISISDRVEAEVRSQARAQTDLVAASATELVHPPRSAALRRLVDTAAETVKGRVVVVNSEGLLLADSAGTDQLGLDYGTRPELTVALSGTSSQRTRESQTLKREILATAAPIVSGEHTLGAVRVTQSTADVNAAVRRVVLGFIAIGLIVLLLGLLAGVLIARQFARPMRRIERAAKTVAGGDLKVSVPEQGSSEERSLAHSFNEMTVRIEELLASQQRFVADASHQLRTPLTGLRLRIEEAQAVAQQRDAKLELEAGLKELDRLAEIVGDLLTLSRAGEREADGEPIILADFVRETVERFETAAAERQLKLTCEAADEAAVFCAQRDLARALEALLENAIIYSPSGGVITVSQAGTAISVLDSGPGIAPDEEEKLFERFYRGRGGRDTEGTGLGLAIARTLIRRWGGEVTIENRASGGAKATVSLPKSSG